MTYISKEELLRVLYFIKKRPAMYLYPVTLTSLGNFLAGYQFSCEEDIWIDENHKAVWQSTSELYLDPKTMNCGKCAKCHGWTTDMEKPNYINGLCNGATVDGELLCDECLPEGHRWAF